MEIEPHAHRPVLNPCTLDGRNYQVDPYFGCGHYCYVLNQAETDWTEEVWYHENIAGRLEEAISGIQPQSIYMGWHTDPYQPFIFKILGRQYMFFVLSLGGSLLFFGALSKSKCIKCNNFSCVFNRVPKTKTDAYLKRNPIMAKAWVEAGWRMNDTKIS